ncbi:PKD domain-containing protein, partial [bacterium]|nr:PKD domain-containing protein [bacterium]
LTTPQTAIWNDGDNDNITNTGQAPVEIILVWEWEELGGVRVDRLRETITLAPGLTYTVDFPSIQEWKNAGPASIVVDADPYFEIWTYKTHVTADVKMGALLQECGDQDFIWYRYFSERKSRVASLGDFVWWDFNANGIQETGETGLENVTVNLFSTDSQLLDTQTTVANGYYLFDGLLPADYVVQFVAPDGFVVSPMHQGGIGKDSDAGLNGFSLPVTLGSGEVNLTIDAGFFKKLTPHVLCISVEGDVMRAKLGYTNPNPKPITVPVGIENGFAGGSGPDMGQPNVFLPGQHDFHSQEAFLIEVPLAATLFWNLCGTTLPIDENLAFGDTHLQATVGFTADIQTGIGPLTVQFQNTSTNSEDFLWDFGDGSTSREKNPIHSYGTQKKYYTVTLTCLACGTNKHETKENFITVLKPSTVNFEGAPISGIVGTEVAFYNNSGGLANVFEWDFGDGSMVTYQHDHTNKVHPLHQYNLPGEYAVTLKANGQGGMAELTIPGMVYIDAEDDYIQLDLVENGPVYEDCGWENVIDHDVYGIGCSVAAEAEDAEAIFKIQNEAVYEVNVVRVLVESVEGAAWPTNLTKQIEILASMDGVTFVPAFSGELNGRRGAWDLFELTTPFAAKFVKINLLETRGEFAKYRELVEFQLFGQEIDETAALMRNNGTEADDLIPETFGLAQNYPNPFN